MTPSGRVRGQERGEKVAGQTSWNLPLRWSGVPRFLRKVNVAALLVVRSTVGTLRLLVAAFHLHEGLMASDTRGDLSNLASPAELTGPWSSSPPCR